MIISCVIKPRSGEEGEEMGCKNCSTCVVQQDVLVQVAVCLCELFGNGLFLFLGRVGGTWEGAAALAGTLEAP